MGVCDEVRQVERVIDAHYEGLPCWQAPRDTLLRSILDWYRDAVEMVFMRTTWAAETNQPDKAVDALNLEQSIHAGVLQLLKWAGTWGQATGGDETRLPEDNIWLPLAQEAQLYVNLVDALKMANNHLHELRLLSTSKTLEVYEGGNRTGHDRAVVERQHETNPFHLHAVFTADADQLTTAWSAGDFRRVAARIVEAANAAESETVVTTLHGERDAFVRPVVFEVPDFGPDDAALLDDLSFPSASLSDGAAWRWTSWMDSPLVVVGGKRYAVSNLDPLAETPC